jgi:hypothetical protein
MPSPLEFPHCDRSVLHNPTLGCEFCNAFPERQQLREIWGINFTGENDPNKTPCPSTRYRSVEHINRWPGNRPKREDGTDVEPPTTERQLTIYDRIRENPFKDERTSPRRRHPGDSQAKARLARWSEPSSCKDEEPSRLPLGASPLRAQRRRSRAPDDGTQPNAPSPQRGLLSVSTRQVP